MQRLRWMTILALATAAVPINTAHAIPAFARKYNMNCSGCHAPAAPRLNATGFAFKWAGYRMPDEIGENQEIKNWSEVIAARVGARYNWAKTESKSVSTNAFAAAGGSLYGSAAVGKWFGVLAEFEGSTPSEQIYSVWGKKDQYGGFRFANYHSLTQGVVAGFDQATGINSVTVLTQALTKGGIPFKFSAGETGLEAFYVIQKNRLSVSVLNGVDGTGTAVTTGSPRTKDFAVTDQLMYDKKGSGVTAMAYYGSVPKADTSINKTAHFTRLAVSANKIISQFEVSGGYAYGQDNDLPVGTVFKANSITGTGYWGYLGYTLPNDLTAYGRYEYLNTNHDVANTGNTRYVLGSVLPVNLPEYMRLAAEGTLDDSHKPGSLKSYTFSIYSFLAF